MKENRIKELPYIALIIIPYIYLFIIWENIAESVPIHWDSSGSIDNYGSKWLLLLIPLILPGITYIALTLVPKIDPKKNISKMGKKYDKLKFILTFVMFALAMYIIKKSSSSANTDINLIFVAIGFLFLVLGNYFKTIKPNYFIGIRTPWTLDNETIWKETHHFAGNIWFVGGIIIILSSLALLHNISFIIFISITVVITIVPIIFSYLKYKRLKK